MGESLIACYLVAWLVIVAVSGDFSETACRLFESFRDAFDVLSARTLHGIAVVLRPYLPVDIAVFVLCFVRRPLRVVDELPADEGDGDSPDVYDFRQVFLASATVPRFRSD